MDNIASKRSYRKAPQSAELINIPGARLRMALVQQVVGLAPSTIYAKIAKGEFPQPVRSGTRCSRWVSDHIRAYLAQQ